MYVYIKIIEVDIYTYIYRLSKAMCIKCMQETDWVYIKNICKYRQRKTKEKSIHLDYMDRLV